MADQSPPTEDANHTSTAKDRPPAAGMPGWVKVSLIVVGLLVVAFIVLQLLGVGGDHGPGRHMRPSHSAPAINEDALA
jgi:hypothetical protein